MTIMPINFHTDYQYLQANQIAKNNWNPNYVSEDMMNAIKDDIRKHGFIGAIIIQKHNTDMKADNVIINGEHRYDALVQLGVDKIPCHILDIDDRTARLLTLRLNREHGDLMPDKVLSLLESLQNDLDLDVLQELTAMPIQELELLTALDISEVTDKKAGDIPDAKMDEGQEKEIEELFDEEKASQGALTLTWSNIEALVEQLAVRIKAAQIEFDMIAAVGNGGLIPARLMQRELGIDNVRMILIDRKKKDFLELPEWPLSQRVLVVDDIFDTGKTMMNILDNLKRNYDPVGAVLVAKVPVADEIFRGFTLLDTSPNYKKWIIFPWEKGIEK
jgi:uncharacterized protein